MKTVQMNKILSVGFALTMALHSWAKTEEVLHTLNSVALESDQLLQVAGDSVVYIDKSGRLYASKLDGSDTKYLSGVTPIDSNPDDDIVPVEDEAKRILVSASKKNEFAIVKTTDSYVVYFQGRKNISSFSAKLFKVDIKATALPEEVMGLSQVGQEITKKSDNLKHSSVC